MNTQSPNSPWNVESLVMEVSGIELTGQLRWTSRDISVLMDHPFPGIESGLHIPHFARTRKSYSNHVQRQATAQRLLLHLYTTGCYVLENREVLTAALRELDEQV